MLLNMNIKDFNALLASKEPAPGGGSVSALSGSLAAGLGLMAHALTVNKKAYAEVSDEVKATMSKASAKLEALKSHLEELVEDDTAAFNEFMAAMKMPKSTDNEKAARKAAMDISGERIIDVPFSTLKRCYEVLEILTEILPLCNSNCISDLAVGAKIAYAGMYGAKYNVCINNPKGEKREKLHYEMEKMFDKATEYTERIHEYTMKSFEGEN
ncbi:MAG: cyclodeaminase/cyclohydrolase family protein [Defluviitaleaceae bacterium]|nr:cyclodeaminase/cyclohydrolase family protein [Defluviitaleaceae bacterium]